MKSERLACLIASRNLGDIVMWSGLLEELIAARCAERFVVWTRPPMAWIFAGLPDCEVICSSFPVGTKKEFGGRQSLRFLAAAARIRALKPSVSVDFVGDFRERLFARMIGSPRHLHIGWESGHPYARVIRNPLGRGRPLITVPESVPNVYAAYGLMVRALTKRKRVVDALESHRQRRGRDTGPYRVGLHPFASLACKLWSPAKWERLARELLNRGYDVTAFAAASEGEALRHMFAGLDGRITLDTTDLAAFDRVLPTLDIVIGLDSVAVHMAHRRGVPSITINAGAPPELWAVPSGRMLAASGGCPHYPCHNVAPCRGTPYQNACVEAITPDEVLGAIDSLRQRQHEVAQADHSSAEQSGDGHLRV